MSSVGQYFLIEWNLSWSIIPYDVRLGFRGSLSEVSEQAESVNLFVLQDSRK